MFLIFSAIIAISCINICQVPWELLKTEAEGHGFQHLPRDLANVNTLKNHVRSLYWYPDFNINNVERRRDIKRAFCKKTKTKKKKKKKKNEIIISVFCSHGISGQKMVYIICLSQATCVSTTLCSSDRQSVLVTLLTINMTSTSHERCFLNKH